MAARGGCAVCDPAVARQGAAELEGRILASVKRQTTSDIRWIKAEDEVRAWRAKAGSPVCDALRVWVGELPQGAKAHAGRLGAPGRRSV